MVVVGGGDGMMRGVVVRGWGMEGETGRVVGSGDGREVG